MNDVRAEGLRPCGARGRSFDERDCGIPQIDRLLSKLGDFAAAGFASRDLANAITVRALGEGHDAWVFDDGSET